MKARTVLVGSVMVVVALALAVGQSSAGDQGMGQEVVDSKPVVTDSAGESPVPVDDLISAVGEWMDENPKLLVNWSGMIKRSESLLSVFWAHGAPSEFVNFLRDRNLSGVSVESAPFSSDEIDAEIAALAKKFPYVPLWVATREWTGITARLSSKTKVPDFAGASIPVAVEFREGPGAIDLSGRGDDIYPFYGGGQIFQSGTSNTCTTGFKVEFSGGAQRLVTARHCGVSSDFRSPENIYTSFPVTRRFVGSSLGGNVSTDSMLLAPSASSGYFYRIFTGDWTVATSRLVVGAHPIVLDDVICAEGGFSGQQCTNRIADANATQVVDGVARGPGFIAVSDSGNGQAGQGDSGGPSVKLVSGGTSLKVAGMISASAGGASPVTCNGFTAYRLCFAEIFYVKLGAILNAHNVSLVTSD